jgi:type II restriction/modification system DNA methylase subunit YeeA
VQTEPLMTPSAFATKWKGSFATEKAAAQEHFIDLCHLLGEPTPNEADPTGEHYAFEKRVTKGGGGDGFADVWKRGFFAWEYKGKRHDLKAAYKQLLDYREDLENPPLLIVSDIERIEIHTNFTGLKPVVETITLDEMAVDPSRALYLLRDVFAAPEEFRPRIEPAQITEKAAKSFAGIAQSLRDRGHDPQQVAHFLDRILFCLFAEDAGLLPKGILGRLSLAAKGRSDVFTQALGQMFMRMADGGGLFGTEDVDWFDGGLFDSGEVLPLTGTEIQTLIEVSRLNWALIEPAIFGTLFERGLDPDQRAQLGAHYTGRDDIWKLVEPVILRPLRREYAEMQTRVTQLILADKRITKATPKDQDPNAVFEAFLDRLRGIRVLDPACGSGNFLIIALWALKDLEFEAIQWGSLVLKRPMQLPQIGPAAALGIELNAYAAELARVTVWIGEIQWMIRHGLGWRSNPILRRLDTIENRDALLDLSDPTNPREAEWPAAEFIVGNPPFLGGKWMRRGLGDAYVNILFSVYDGRVPREADFVTYWHEKARAWIEAGRTRRAGLLANQSIRSGANRKVLHRITETGQLFFARADDPWVLKGASVHISFVAQDDGSETDIELDGHRVDRINTDLTSGLDLTSIRTLPENLGISFMGDTKSGPFEIDNATAQHLLRQPNPDGRSNADVVRPWINGEDLNGRNRRMWIIDFGVDLSESEAALYEAPFEYVREHVRPKRLNNTRAAYAEKWWLHVEPRPGLRNATSGLRRYIATTRVSPHRIFAWVPVATLPDSRLIAFATDEDYVFGLLHSRVHETWSRHTAGAQRREAVSGFTYTPSTCFETFPFPDPTPELRERVGEAAKRLDDLRSGWLNPPGLEPADLEKRTLTNLYNQRPTWLVNAHEELDRAVLDAYGWPHDMSDEQILQCLLAMNLERAAQEANG